MTLKGWPAAQQCYEVEQRTSRGYRRAQELGLFLGFFSKSMSAKRKLRPSSPCWPSWGCTNCWRWRCSYAGRCEVWQGRCGRGRGESWPVRAPWGGWTNTAPRTGHRPPPRSPPSAGGAPAATGRLRPGRLPGADSPESSILHSPCLPLVRPPGLGGRTEKLMRQQFGWIRRWTLAEHVFLSFRPEAKHSLSPHSCPRWHHL